MKFRKKIALSGLLCGFIVTSMAFQNVVFAGHADKSKKGVEATVSCGGNYFSRKGGTELHRSTYVLRNVADEGAINLESVRVYDAKGTILFDSTVSGIPTFYNGVLSALDSTLDPHQSAQLRIVDMIPAQGRNNRPLQTVLEWSADAPVLTLEAVNVRTVADVDPVTGKVGQQRGRHLYECRTTSLKKRW